VTVGMVLAAVAANTLDLVLVVVAAAVLGVGYGLGLVSGLLEVQRIATPAELAGLSAVFYVLTYVGFAIPVALAHLTGVAAYPTLLAALAGLSLLSLAVVRVQAPRCPLPEVGPNG
jgi:hypothetical protein